MQDIYLLCEFGKILSLGLLVNKYQQNHKSLENTEVTHIAAACSFAVLKSKHIEVLTNVIKLVPTLLQLARLVA